MMAAGEKDTCRLYLFPLFIDSYVSSSNFKRINIYAGETVERSLELPEAGYCGETISGTCTALLSTRLTLEISGSKSHTFTPNGDQKTVLMEGVSLSLMELTPTWQQDQFKFVVSISFTMRETLTISCRNDKVNEMHTVLLQSNATSFYHTMYIHIIILNH